MAVGEYVSVSAQRDAEQADVNLETRELADRPQDELKELAQIYMKRGLDETLAMKVAEQLSGRDRLAAFRVTIGGALASGLLLSGHGIRSRPAPFFRRNPCIGAERLPRRHPGINPARVGARPYNPRQALGSQPRHSTRAV